MEYVHRSVGNHPFGCGLGLVLEVEVDGWMISKVAANAWKIQNHGNLVLVQFFSWADYRE